MPLARAERDLQKVHADVARLEAQLSELKQKAVKISHFIEMLGVYGSADINEEVHANRSNPSASKTVNAVVEILTENGRPMKTKELLEALALRGILIGGQIPANNLSGTLSKADIFQSDRANGWSLKTSSDESLRPQISIGDKSLIEATGDETLQLSSLAGIGTEVIS